MKAIFACDDKGGIGKDGGIPWPKSENDLKRFKDLTLHGIVVMGRGTWESKGMPKPLPKRRNVVISTQELDLPSDVIRFNNTIMLAGTPTAWIIGGAQLINSLLEQIDEIYISRFEGDYDCDATVDLDYIKQHFDMVHEFQDEDHVFQLLKRIDNETVS